MFDLETQNPPRDAYLNLYRGMRGTVSLIPGTDYILQHVIVPSAEGYSFTGVQMNYSSLYDVLTGETPVRYLRLWEKSKKSAHTLFFDIKKIKKIDAVSEYNHEVFKAQMLFKFIPNKLKNMEHLAFRDFYHGYYFPVIIDIDYYAPMKVRVEGIIEHGICLQFFGAVLWSFYGLVEQFKILSSFESLNDYRRPTQIPAQVTPPIISSRIPICLDGLSPLQFIGFSP